MGEEPAHVEDTEVRGRDAHHRLADLRVGQLQEHHGEQHGGHEARGEEGVANVDDQRQGRSAGSQPLLHDEPVELVNGNAAEGNHHAHVPEPTDVADP